MTRSTTEGIHVPNRVSRIMRKKSVRRDVECWPACRSSLCKVHSSCVRVHTTADDDTRYLWTAIKDTRDSHGKQAKPAD
jgi:hypothetical protein